MILLPLLLALTVTIVSSSTCDNGNVTALADWQQKLMLPDQNMGG